MGVTVLIWALIGWQLWRWYQKYHFPDCGFYCEKQHWQKLHEITKADWNRREIEYRRKQKQQRDNRQRGRDDRDSG